MSDAQFAANALMIRMAEARLTSHMQTITDIRTWSGPDRDSFEREWNDLVRGPLLAAASKLDALATTPFI